MLWICPHCGFRAKMEPHEFPVTCRCGKKSDISSVGKTQPNLVQKVVRYASAVDHWRSKGMPTRPPEEIDWIYENRCSPCDKFNGKSCGVCGCSISKSKHGLRNKIAMRTENCPMGRWGASSFLSEPRFIRPNTLSLAYHIYADKHGDTWKRNLDQIKRRIDIFNGEVVFAIAYGPNTVPVEEVISYINHPLARYLMIENHPELRERHTFNQLLDCLPTEPGHAFFFAHTKGTNSDGDSKGIMYWRNSMYHHLLDRMEDVLLNLEFYPFVGCHKIVWGEKDNYYPTKLVCGKGMLAGTYWWAQSSFVFNHKDCYNAPMDRYGVEAYPALLSEPEEWASMHQIWPEYQFPTPSPYDPRIYNQPIPDPV